MGAPSEGLLELLTQLAEEHGEDAVRAALSLTPLLSSTRDAAQFHLETATRAHRYDGPSGSLVLEVPRKPNEPVECTWLGETRLTLELEVLPKQQRRRGA